MSAITTLLDGIAASIFRSQTNTNFANLNADKQETSGKDATGGYVGLTLFKINFKNAANTFTNFFTNATTAARTYTFQDRDGTIADNIDLALKAPLASPTFTGTVIVPTPVGGTEATTKNYVDAAITGLKWKAPVRVATTTNGTLATAYENGDTIDGVVLATNDRILLKNQTTQTENGIYTVNASGAPTRATDADTGTEIVQASVFVSEGTANADIAFVCTNNSITIGSTNIVFVQFTGGGALTASTGITITGNAISIDTATTVDKTTAQTLSSKTLTKPVINGSDPTGATYAPSSGAQTVALDCITNNMHIVTGHASGTAITFTVANATNNQVFIVSILQGAVVSTITGWFATVRWAGGTIPTLTATVGKRDTFAFIRTGANTYDGFIIGQNC